MPYEQRKRELLDTLRREGIHDEVVLDAMSRTPREAFVSASYSAYAYDNVALPIECGQTISQPYVVARMSQLLRLGGDLSKVLEVGTGSGYQAAVLSHFVDEVYTIERIYQLYQQASERFERLGYDNIAIHYGDGFDGWPEHAPYDGMLITAACEDVPQHLLSQLTTGGRIVVPLVRTWGVQQLCVVEKTHEGTNIEPYDPVMFVSFRHGTE